MSKYLYLKKKQNRKAADIRPNISNVAQPN